MKVVYDILNLERKGALKIPLIYGNFNSRSMYSDFKSFFKKLFILVGILTLLFPLDWQTMLVISIVASVPVCVLLHNKFAYYRELLNRGLDTGMIISTSDCSIRYYNDEIFFEYLSEIGEVAPPDEHFDIPQEGPYLGKNKFRIIQAGQNPDDGLNYLGLTPEQVDENNGAAYFSGAVEDVDNFCGSPDWVKHVLYTRYGPAVLWRPGIISPTWDPSLLFINYKLDDCTGLEFYRSQFHENMREVNESQRSWLNDRKIKELEEYISYYPHKFDNTSIWEWMHQSKKCARGNFYSNELRYVLKAIGSVCMYLRKDFHFPPGTGDLSITL